ncbi:hypothetical protein THRCLA_01083 [Thraustotheca clavata]|uniref:RING-type domain-containing protein n=1 Tax=Thraustotheca clavata TaxID=74557 RepID=A0A1W0A9P1_9STRA|nr:hypothetical protein THRCLA_01083 [Thraustotheca clavata]
MALPWELAIGSTPIQRTLKVSKDAQTLYKVHHASMHQVDVDHVQDIGSITLKLENQTLVQKKPKKAQRVKRIEHSFDPAADECMHKEELDEILMAEEWDTRFWNNVKIHEAVNTLYREIEVSTDIRRRKLAVKMILHLNRLHPEANAYNDNNMANLTNKAFMKLTPTINHDYVYNMAELIAVFAPLFPAALASENAVFRALQCILRSMDIAARVLQHMQRRVVFERCLRRREISLEARMRARSINLAKTIDLQRQQNEIRDAMKERPMPERAVIAYMTIVLELIKYEFDHKNQAHARQDHRKIYHTGALVFLVQCIKRKGALESLALELFCLLAQEKERVCEILQSNVVKYIFYNIRHNQDGTCREKLLINDFDVEVIAKSIEFINTLSESVLAMAYQLNRPRDSQKKMPKQSFYRTKSSLSKLSMISDSRDSTTSIEEQDAIYFNRNLDSIVKEHLLSQLVFEGLFALLKAPNHTFSALQVLHKLAHDAAGYFILLDIATKNAGRYLESIVACLIHQDTTIVLAALQVIFALASRSEGRDAMTTAGLVHLVKPLCNPGFRCPGNSYRFVVGLLVITANANASQSIVSFSSLDEETFYSQMRFDITPSELLDRVFEYLLQINRADPNGDCGVYFVETNSLVHVLDLLLQPLHTTHPQSRAHRHISTIVISSLARVRALAQMLTFRDDVLRHIALALQTNRMEESEGVCFQGQEQHMHLMSISESCRALLRFLRCQEQLEQPRDVVIAAQYTICRALFQFHVVEDIVAYIRPPNLVSDFIQADLDAVKCAIQIIGLVCPCPLLQHVNHESTKSILRSGADHKEIILNIDMLQTMGTRLIQGYLINHNTWLRHIRVTPALLNTIAADEPLPRVVKWCCKSLAQLGCTNASCSLLLSYRCMDVISMLIPNIPSDLHSVEYRDISSQTVITSTTVDDEKLMALPPSLYTLLAVLCRVSEGREAVVRLNVLPRTLKRLHIRSSAAGWTKRDHRCRTELIGFIKAMAHVNAIGIGNVNEFFLRHHVHTVCMEMLEPNTVAPSIKINLELMHENALGALGALAKDHIRCVPPLLSVGVLPLISRILVTYEPDASLTQLESALQIVLAISLYPSETVHEALVNANIKDSLMRIGCSFHLEMIKSKTSISGTKSLGELARETLRHMGNFAKKQCKHCRKYASKKCIDATPTKKAAQSPSRSPTIENNCTSLPALKAIAPSSTPSTPTKAASLPKLPDLNDLRHTRPSGPYPQPNDQRNEEPYRFARPKKEEAQRYPFLMLDPLFSPLEQGVDPCVPHLAMHNAINSERMVYPAQTTSSLGHHVELRRSPSKEVSIEAHMQRRLSNLQQDGYMTQCHVLYVGSKLVYRVTIQTPVAWGLTWVAGVSKVKLDTFYNNIQQLADTIRASPAGISEGGHVESLIEYVYDVAVKIHGSNVANGECTQQVEQFVLEMLSAFTFLTSIEAADINATAMANEVLRFYILLREFLMIPDDVQSARNRLTVAVMSLTDVSPPQQPGGCSICLETWQSIEESNLPTVKLPCNHVFHEECVMEWIRQSAKCPVCRANIGQQT